MPYASSTADMHLKDEQALADALDALERAIGLMSPADPYRPPLIQVRCALLGRLRRAPLVAVPHR